MSERLQAEDHAGPTGKGVAPCRRSCPGNHLPGERKPGCGSVAHSQGNDATVQRSKARHLKRFETKSARLKRLPALTTRERCAEGSCLGIGPGSSAMHKRLTLRIPAGGRWRGESIGVSRDRSKPSVASIGTVNL